MHHYKLIRSQRGAILESISLFRLLRFRVHFCPTLYLLIWCVNALMFFATFSSKDVGTGWATSNLGGGALVHLYFCNSFAPALFIHNLQFHHTSRGQTPSVGRLEHQHEFRRRVARSTAVRLEPRQKQTVN